MSKPIIVAIDAMGGDMAPDMVVAGVASARVQYPEIRYRLYGDGGRLEALIGDDAALSKACDIVHTDTVVTSDDKPSQALRRGRESSMGLAIQAVKDGEANVAISAGNTGALMALSKFMLRMLPGIDRPALISPMPTLRGESVMLDLGANIECSTENLVQFAIMGAAYANAVLGLKTPKVCLLNVGSEDLKGNDRVKDAAEILKGLDGLPIEYGGYIEGDAIGRGEADVIVTDGFTGNIALKTMEGTAKFVGAMLRQAFESSLSSKLGYVLSRSAMQALSDHLNPNNHNGGVFLGLNGLVVKSHGGADASGFASAVTTAIDLVRHDMQQQISDNLKYLSDTLDAA